ncbi:MAG: nicotinamide-nucleotide adenylyltransferase [Halobacteriales archaeon]
MTRGCFIGRFQPFHLGHRRVVESVENDLDGLVVVVGSAGASHSVQDPFTGGERVRMVRQALSDLDLVTYAVPVEDVNKHGVWVRHLESMTPAFDVVYANNPLVVRLFEEAGREVRRVEMHDRDRLEGTRIREAMVADEAWRHLVPDQVVSVIEDVDGVERIRAVSDTDTTHG